MDVNLRKSGEWWVVLDGDVPVRTPAGSPVVSRYRELIEEVARDVSRHGVDPTTRTTTYSLQASYLDFGIPVKRKALEENTASIWPDDLFVVRPVSPAFAAPLLALWGPPDLDRGAFREALRGLTLRQLMATMMAGNVLRSAVVGLRVVTTDADTLPLALGACERHFRWLGRGEAPEKGQVRIGGSTGRHRPSDMDEAYCATACCAEGAKDPREFRVRCALHPILDRMRRWASFPEEVEKG
jgi:hypothetical protein